MYLSAAPRRCFFCKFRIWKRQKDSKRFKSFAFNGQLIAAVSRRPFDRCVTSNLAHLMKRHSNCYQRRRPATWHNPNGSTATEATADVSSLIEVMIIPHQPTLINTLVGVSFLTLHSPILSRLPPQASSSEVLCEQFTVWSVSGLISDHSSYSCARTCESLLFFIFLFVFSSPLPSLLRDFLLFALSSIYHRLCHGDI